LLVFHSVASRPECVVIYDSEGEDDQFSNSVQ
jgi:hypothetical protein